jgi:hypothetical protein
MATSTVERGDVIPKAEARRRRFQTAFPLAQGQWEAFPIRARPGGNGFGN